LLIVIDEAQRLKPKLAHELNLLMNISIKNKKPINTLLLIRDKERKNPSEKNPNIYNIKILSHHHLEPLSQEDTSWLIKHRLKVSGTDKLIFTKEAMLEIYKFSRGNPRLTNSICDRTLLTGYAAGSIMISKSIVSECAKELKISKFAA
jgi:general secretion pathway protein A